MIHLVVFNDYILGNAAVYTAESLNHTLGQFSQLAIHCVVDNQDLAGSIQCQISHSGDGRNWLAKYPGPGEISAPNNVPALGTVANLQGFDQGAMPSFALVRLAITLVAPCTKARVRISVTGRSTRP